MDEKKFGSFGFESCRSGCWDNAFANQVEPDLGTPTIYPPNVSKYHHLINPSESIDMKV